MQSIVKPAGHLGSAKEGANHWKLQRLTAIGSLVLVIWFVFQAVSMTGSSHAEWVAWFASPVHATGMILLVVSSFYHAQLGLQVVVEDYVHHAAGKVVLLAGIKLVIAALATGCIVSIIMLAAGV